MIDRLLDIEVTLFGWSISGRKLVKNPFFKGSAIMIIGSNIANVLAYLYHLIMGRILGPASYGELAAALSLLGIVSTAYSFMTFVVMKFVSSARRSEVPSAVKWFTWVAVFFGGVIMTAVFLAAPILASFLHVPVILVHLVAPILFFSVLTAVYKSFLQGLLKFPQVALIVNLDMGGRIIFGVAFVLLGLSTIGAVGGLLATTILNVAVLLFLIPKWNSTTKRFNGSAKVLSYSVPLIIATMANNSFYLMDVILAKHFLPAFDAGLYASLSSLGKIIFFASAPVTSVMFPLVSKKHSQGKKNNQFLFLSLGIAAFVGLGVTTVYALFPKLMIEILYGSKYLAAAPQLALFGMFISFFTMSSIANNYFLSKDKLGSVYLFAAGAISQIVGIVLFHSSIREIVTVSTTIAALTLFSILTYGWFQEVKR